MAAEQLQQQLERIARELGGDAEGVQLEAPRNPEHGDVASNLALVLARPLRRNPRELAQQIVARLELAEAGIEGVEIAGPGFINFRFANASVQALVTEIIDADRAYGRAITGAGRRVLVEFVSANPTGPLHVAHGRGAALGDAIASLLDWTGHAVSREFYVNDAGVQIDRLAESVDARWRELQGETAPIPEGGYHGAYVQELARTLQGGHDELATLDGAERVRVFRERAVSALRVEQDADLRAFGVFFDSYFAESTLYAENRLPDTLAELSERGLTYEQEGATWLRSSAFGDDKDRVLVKSDGSYTYFLPDIAYHRDKARRGFQHAINVWGADHHGYVPRMKAALAALGLPDFLDIEIVQMVRIMRGGTEAKFSKRSGDFVTLRELFEETGPDVARYFFLMRRSDTQMLFDLDLALDQSEKNPVYKVQYAHARMMSIFRRGGMAVEDVTASRAEVGALRHETERALIKQLSTFPKIVERAAEARAPHIVCDYLEATAGMVNSWYHAGNPSRNPELAVLAPDPGTRRARLALARATRIVLRNGLELLGLAAPERMDREESE
jgi:arginyl-tRNA synthetase